MGGTIDGAGLNEDPGRPGRRQYLVTHPRGRLTRFVVRFAVRRVEKRLLS